MRGYTMETNMNLLKKLPVNRSHPSPRKATTGRALGVGLLVLSLALATAAPLCAMEGGDGQPPKKRARAAAAAAEAASADKKNCMICYESEDQQFCLFPCCGEKQGTHKSCLFESIQRSLRCPMCRGEIPEVFLKG